MARRSDFARDYRDLHGDDPEVIDLQPSGAAWAAPRFRPAARNPMAGTSGLAKLTLAVPLLLMSAFVTVVGVAAVVFGVVVILAVVKGLWS